MHSKKTIRCQEAGFTLLETLIAFSILMAVLGVVYSTAIAITQQSRKVDKRHALQELAFGVLTEYVSTYPTMLQTGTLGDIYQWEITEHPYSVPKSESLIGAKYIEVEIRAWAIDAPETQQSLHTVLAVRAN